MSKKKRKKEETCFDDIFYGHVKIVHGILFIVQYMRLFDKQILQEDNRLGSSAEYLSHLHRSKLQVKWSEVKWSVGKGRKTRLYVKSLYE